MSSYNVIIPCCGNSSHFGGAPKHLIDIAGKTMLERVIDQFPTSATKVSIYVVTRREHFGATVHLAGSNVIVIWVKDYSKGVCETLLHAPIYNYDKTLVVNCDNAIKPAMGWDSFFTMYSDAIVTFLEEDTTIEPPPFSYVHVNAAGHVMAVAEKKRIGVKACAGAFLFSDYQTLRLMCQAHMAQDPPDHNGEHYLAPAYSHLIGHPNSTVYDVPLTEGSVFVRMGTPAEAEEARNVYVHGYKG